MKEPEITLFGRKIALPENDGEFYGQISGCAAVGMEKSGGGVKEEEEQVMDEDQDIQELSQAKPEETEPNPCTTEGSQCTNTLSESDDNPKTPAIEEISENQSKSENEQSDATNPSQQKTLKKPDKILPCPRCNSMDTKFCYYNNYNVNQPRHFCKSCQRYWTAGGTMRNVPVGAGRRKNKNLASHCRHITISEALQAVRVDAPNGIHVKPNGTVLSFGPDSPLCESVASGLNLADRRVTNGVKNGYYEKKQENIEAVNDCSHGSSVTTSCSSDKNGPHQQRTPNMNGFPCIQGFPWPLPAVFPPGYPIPMYPAPYWNCGVPNAWNVPWLSVPSPNQSATSSGPNFSPLGKHSRDGELLNTNISGSKENLEQKHSESSIVIPKTLRIDDPEEATKSSIWSTLGIKYDSISREGLFNSLRPKSNSKKQSAAASPAMQANPAALSRSISFQETA